MNKTAATPKPLSIFRAGTHVALDGKPYTFSKDDLQEIADSYDPEFSESPLVVGHPKLDDPAYGWVRSLQVVGDELLAEPHEVDAEFAEAVNAKRFKKISSSIYMRNTPGNPTPGRLYLKHVGFLGAVAPAVKGLRPAQFADGSDAAPEFAQSLSGLGWILKDLFQRLRDAVIERDGIEVADRLVAQWQIDGIAEATAKGDGIDPRAPLPSSFSAPETTESDPMSAAAEFAEREQQMTARQADLDQREAAMKAREALARREEAAAFAEGLASGDRPHILPRQKAAVVELLLALPADAVLNFAEGDDEVQKPAGDVLRAFLSELPPPVDLAEKTPVGNPSTAVASFAAPAGMEADAARAELLGKAQEYQRAHPTMSLIEAVRAVGG